MDEAIGVAFKRARLQKKMSLRQVAEQLGISTSLLSQVENQKTQPSVKTLFGLAAVLGVSLDEIATGGTGMDGAEVRLAQDQDASAGIQRATDNPLLEMEKGVRWERLATGGRTDIEPLFVTYEPGASSSVDGKLMRHAGVEFAYVLEGTLRLKLEFDEHELRTGDSFCFNSCRPHLFYNAGDVAARGVWFVFDTTSQSSDMNAMNGALRPSSTDTARSTSPHAPLFRGQ